MGLFSRKKTDRTRWNCKFCGKNISINDIGAVKRDNQFRKLEASNREGIVAEKDEVFCNECSQGNLPRDQQIRLAKFGKRIEEDKHAIITLTELTDVITDLEVFISRLNIYNPYFKERIEQLKSAMEFFLKISGLPKLKQQIVSLIENKKYVEAEALCAQGTHWASLMKEKVNWEQDLQQIELLIEISKSSSGKEKIIDAPDGFQKTVTLKAQIQPESNKYDCFLCKSKITKPQIGMILRDQDAFVFTGGVQATDVQSTDEVLCATCAPKWMAIHELQELEEQGKHPTVHDLRYFEKLWNANSPDGIYEAKKPVSEGHLPANAARYNGVSFNKDKKLEFKSSCPKCSGQLNLVSDKLFEGGTSKLLKLFEDYLAWPAELPITCPLCKENITIHK